MELSRQWGTFTNGEFTGFNGAGENTTPTCNNNNMTTTACAFNAIPPSCTTIQNLHVQMIDNPGQSITWGIVVGAPGSLPGTTNALQCASQTAGAGSSCNSGSATASVTGMGTMALQATWNSSALNNPSRFYAYVECK
jgi:hypothetical protein